MKKTALFFIGLFFTLLSFGQNSSADAKKLLDDVSNKMGAYDNMYIDFSSQLINKEVDIKDPPTRGSITLSGENYNLSYLGNNFVFDGKQLVIINTDEKEVTITSGDMDEDDGFIYPSKLLTFYKEGYTYTMGKLDNTNGRKVQYINLTPIDSNADIKQVKMGVDAKTKHIYKLTQIGGNGTETTFTITKFKSNQPISKNLFSFDASKYEKQGYLID